MTQAQTMQLQGFINNVKKVSDKLTTFSFSIGVKQEDGTFKNGFFNCKTNQGDSVVEKQRVEVDGWLTFDFWVDKDTGKDRQKPIMFVNKITVI